MDNGYVNVDRDYGYLNQNVINCSVCNVVTYLKIKGLLLLRPYP